MVQTRHPLLHQQIPHCILPAVMVAVQSWLRCSHGCGAVMVVVQCCGCAAWQGAHLLSLQLLVPPWRPTTLLGLLAPLCMALL